MGNLFLNRNKTIAVMMGNQRGGFIERCWEALATHARVRSCNLLVLPGEIDLYAGAQGDRYDEAYAFVRAGNVDGVVVMGGNINFQNRYADIVSEEGARRLGLPVAVLGRDVPGVPCAVMTAESGVREAIHHFVDHHGYTRIGFVKGREGHPHAEARFVAYRDALAERGIALDPSLVYPGNFSFTSGIRAVTQMIRDGLDRMDAVFACNDDLALGIVRGLHSHGLSVPSDMRLIGFDDSCEGQSGLTHISSVRQPIQEMAAWVLDAVLEPLPVVSQATLSGLEVNCARNHSGPTTQERVKVFSSTLVVRNSCGCVTDLQIFLSGTSGSGSIEKGAAALEKHQLNAPSDVFPRGLVDRLEARCGWLFARVDQENRFGLGGRDAFSKLLLRFSMSLLNNTDTEHELEKLEMWLIRLVHADDEMTMWEQCLAVLLHELVPEEEALGIARARGAFLHLHASIAEARGNKRRIERFRSNFTQSLRAESLLALAAVSNLDELRIALEKQLPDLGVSRYLLSLFVSPDSQDERQFCSTIASDLPQSQQAPVGFPIENIPVDGFSGDEMPDCAQILFSMGLGMTPELGGWREYPTLQLLPQGHRFSGDRLDVIVEPLFFGSEQYGFQVSELGPFGENLYDTFRPQIAAALHTIGLFRRLQETLNTLRRTQKQLVQSEKMASLGTLVAGFAHELNTPLGIGVTAASFLQQRMVEMGERLDRNVLQTADLERCLQEGMNSTRLLMTHLNKASALVSDFRRVAVDQTSDQRRQFDMAQYLQQILSSLRPRLSRELPDVEVVCPEGLILDTYPGALFQVVSTLLLNSVMHAHPDGRAGKARMRVHREGMDVVLRYEDDGVGIPPETWDRVFDPFYTTARDKGGTGIGLHVAYNAVIQLLAGTITCGASAMGGVRFDVRMLADLSSDRS